MVGALGVASTEVIPLVMGTGLMTETTRNNLRLSNHVNSFAIMALAGSAEIWRIHEADKEGAG